MIYIYMRILYGRLSLLSIELTVVMDENKTHDRKFSGSPKEWEWLPPGRISRQRAAAKQGKSRNIQKQRAPK
jgi:hypothetical protein